MICIILTGFTGQCRVHHAVRNVVDECNSEYDFLNEETRTFSPGWKPYDPNNTGGPEWTYRTAKELDGYPFWAWHALYSGGGYVIGDLYKQNGRFF